MPAEDTDVPAKDETSPFDITMPEPLPEVEASESSAEEVETSPVEETPPVETPATFGDEVLNAAVAAGIPERVAQSFGSERELRGYLDRLKTPTAPTAPQMPSAPALPELAKFDLQLDPENVDPEIAKHFDAMNVHYAGQMKALHEHVGRLGDMSTRMGAVEMTMREQTNMNFDAAVNDFATATEDRKAIFGSVGKPSKGSSEFKERAKLAKTADNLRRLCLIDRVPVQPLSVRLEQAFAIKYSGETAASERSKLEKSIKKRKGQMTARPTQKDIGEEPRSTRKAELAVAEKLREQGALY